MTTRTVKKTTKPTTKAAKPLLQPKHTRVMPNVPALMPRARYLLKPHVMKLVKRYIRPRLKLAMRVTAL
jgi:hypothetical protein